jgi:hypothetical protein
MKTPSPRHHAPLLLWGQWSFLLRSDKSILYDSKPRRGNPATEGGEGERIINEGPPKGGLFVSKALNRVFALYH